jgi:hypothetical protein
VTTIHPAIAEQLVATDIGLRTFGLHDRLAPRKAEQACEERPL